MFKLNTKTHQHAIRALMKCTSLKSRRARYRLRYLARNGLCPKTDSLGLPLKRPRHKHWKVQLDDLIASDPSLEQALEHLSEALADFAGQLPMSKDYSLITDQEMDPVKDFYNAVEEWVWGAVQRSLRAQGPGVRYAPWLSSSGMCNGLTLFR
jgi:hypothetical protein